MHRMAASKVYLHGLGGLGVEIGEYGSPYIHVPLNDPSSVRSKEHCFSWSEGMHVIIDDTSTYKLHAFLWISLDLSSH